uniref:Secreted protein n=1 Tax=Steinernema glaseri TaxID=37863 RepID=A0A1I7ZK49_9BILA
MISTLLERSCRRCVVRTGTSWRQLMCYLFFRFLQGQVNERRVNPIYLAQGDKCVALDDTVYYNGPCFLFV